MAKTTDIGSKRLVSLSPDDWVRWVTGRPDAVAREVISGEFQWLSRATDVLVRAALPLIGEFLVLIEFQLRYQKRMPKRVRAYAGLAEEKYDLPVYCVVVNVLPPGPETVVVTAYDAEFLGQRAHQDFRVINFSEIDAEEVWRQPFPGLAPFVPVLRGGAEVPMVRRALETIRAHEQLQGMEALLAFMASLVMDTEIVKQIVRWDMDADVIEQGWFWQEITQRGNAKMLLLQVEQLFGPPDQATRERIRYLPPAQLEALAKVLFSFKTKDDLTAWLGALDPATTTWEPSLS
jgi:predicted transposase YdaD